MAETTKAAAPSFNLLDEPWIKVRDKDGRVSELSLLQAFEAAPGLADLAGEMPTQDAAVLRLMLAVLHRVMPARSTFDDSVDAWAEVWEAGALPMQDITAYVNGFRDRFDMCHPEHPFGQVPGLRTAKDREPGVVKLIGEYPYGVPHFTTRGGREILSLSMSEAARWLVHCQAYDPSGIKPGAVGDNRVKAGKGYPIGTGWAGAIGLFVLQGRSLFETLLLNLVVPASTAQDRPVWERPPIGPGAEGGHEQPIGPADLMTWPSRRVALTLRDGQVVDSLVTNGDRIEPQDRQALETMSVWRDSEAQAKKLGRAQVTMPRLHQPARALWRGLPATLEAGTSTSPVAPMQSQEWVARLSLDQVLPPDYPLRMRAVGMVYGAQSSSVADTIDDSVLVRPAVLAQPDVRGTAVAAVRAAEGAANALAWFAELLFQAGGGDGRTEAEVHRTAAREAVYALLDLPYRRALRMLGPATDLGTWSTQWEQEVRDLVTEEAERMVRAAGRPALVGRGVGESRSDYVDAASALSRLNYQLRKRLPLAYPEASPDPDVDQGDVS